MFRNKNGEIRSGWKIAEDVYKRQAQGNSRQVAFSNHLGVLSWSLSRMIPVFVALCLGPTFVDTLNAIMPPWLSSGLSIAAGKMCIRDRK